MIEGYKDIEIDKMAKRIPKVVEVHKRRIPKMMEVFQSATQQ